MFQLDPDELHDFPDRLFRRALQVPANLRELMEDLDPELASRLDFEQARVWQREHIYEDWRRFERDLPFLIPYRSDPDQHLLLCLLLEHQSRADRMMPLRMLLYGATFWEGEWRAWEARDPKTGPLELTPILPVVFHTGLTRWISNRTLRELVGGAEELRDVAPQWPIRFWDLAERTPDQLLTAASPWLNALAVVRATDEDSATFRGVFAGAVERIAGLVNRERMRWRDLSWMLISWALRRRPREERQGLVAEALERQPDPRTYQEVLEMSTTLGQTLEQWAREQGLKQGLEQGQIVAYQRLLAIRLEERFGDVPEGLRQRIQGIRDLDRLEGAIRGCSTVQSPDELGL